MKKQIDDTKAPRGQRTPNVHEQLRGLFGVPKRDPRRALGRGLKEAIADVQRKDQNR